MTSPHNPDDRDPLAAYAAGDPNTVRAAAPREPSEADWDAVHRRIRARLNRPQPPTPRRAVAWALAGATAFAAAAVAGVAFMVAQPKVQQAPEVPGVADGTGVPVGLVVAGDSPAAPDPLAEFAVLPMARGEDVVLNRVPGDGWLPVGADPLPGTLALATAAEVTVEDADATWPHVAPEPGYAPMIFAAKPR